MAKNQLGTGAILSLVAPVGGVVSGNAYKFGALIVVALASADAGATYAAATVGVFKLPKVTGTAFVAGDALYWDDAAKNFTKTSAGNTLAGIAVAAAASGDTFANVRLNGYAA